jgi:hypothetical protein
MNFIAKVAEALAPSPDIPLVLLDMFGFDGWCGSYAISQAARGGLVLSWVGLLMLLLLLLLLLLVLLLLVFLCLGSCSREGLSC